MSIKESFGSSLMEPYRKLPYTWGMDVKKKLEDTYIPDKEGRKERIAVGLSGGIDSYVAAYLLKIQKYEVFGVTVQAGRPSLDSACYLNEAGLNHIREFCQQLKIPHYLVKGTSEFQEEVIAEWTAAKVTGSFSNACWSCHALRMRLLHRTMEELEADYIATGHYAKLFHQEAQNRFFVHSSNDEKHDQSALLSRLPHEVLGALKLPLSDLQKKEVQKLAENFGLTSITKKTKMFSCLPDTEEALENLRDAVPAKFLQEGEIVALDGTGSFGNHEGIIYYRYGEKLEVSGSDSVYLTGLSFKDKKMFVAPAEHFARSSVLLTDCHFSEATAWPVPLKGALRYGNEQFVECWVRPNSLGGAFVEWEGEVPLKEGEMVSVFRKKGKNSKVYLTGKIKFLGPIEVEEKGEKSVEIHYGRDF